MTKENWRPIAGYEGLYEVSDQGRARSLDRIVQCGQGGTRKIAGQILTLSKGGQHGHLTVSLSRDSTAKKFLIHRVVLEAFVGPAPPGLWGLHWDDDPANNKLSNLRWGTRSENWYDCVRNGNHRQARKTHCPEGHPLVPRPGYEPHRWCPICHRAGQRRWWEKMRDAKRAATECPQGHPLSTGKDGRKYCFTCTSKRIKQLNATRTRDSRGRLV